MSTPPPLSTVNPLTGQTVSPFSVVDAKHVVAVPPQTPNADGKRNFKLVGVCIGVLVLCAVAAGVLFATRRDPAISESSESSDDASSVFSKVSSSASAGFNILTGENAAAADPVIAIDATRAARRTDGSGGSNSTLRASSSETTGLISAWTFTRVNSISRQSSTSFFETASAMAVTKSSKVGVDFKTGFFSLNTEVSDFRRTQWVTKGNTFRASSEYTFVAYEAVSPTNVQPSQLFQDAIARLPRVSEHAALPPEYAAVYERFGTHFTSSVELGGTIAMETSIDSSSTQVESLTSADFRTGIEATFFSTLGLTTDTSTASEALRSRIGAASTTSLRATGGRLSLVVGGAPDVSAWVDSITAENADVVSRTVKPIWMLVSNPSKQLAMKRAFEAFVSKCPVAEGEVCGGKGACDPSAGTCTCWDSRVSGRACNVTACDEPCNDGTCDLSTGECVCKHWARDDPDTGEKCKMKCVQTMTFMPRYGGRHSVDQKDDDGNCGGPAVAKFCAHRFGPNWVATRTFRIGSEPVDETWRNPYGTNTCEDGWFTNCYAYTWISCIDRRCPGVVPFLDTTPCH